MVNETLKATGRLDIVLLDQNNNIKQQVSVPNLVVTVGKNFIASRMVGTASAAMSHMAVGTSNANLAAANTALAAQLTRVALTSATATNSTVTYVGNYGAGVGTGALVEAGIFNDATTGTMLCRTTFPVINKEASDTLTINWVVTIS